MSSAVRLGRFAGAGVVADASALLLSLLFAGGVFVYLLRSVPDVANETAGTLAVLAGAAVVGCIFIHEAAHVVVAQWRGLSVRSIRLLMLGGYSVIDGVPSPRTELLVAGAGPLASLLLGLVLLAGSNGLGSDTVVGATLQAVGYASVAIGVFNLLPGFPLDGGRLVRSALVIGGRDRGRATRDVTIAGRVLGAAAMVAGLYLLLSRQIVGLFWVVGGWFLMSAAVSSGKREELSVAFDGMRVEDLMRPTAVAVSGDATISEVLDEHATGARLASLPVEMSDRVVGVIGQGEIDSIAPSRWPSIRARALMTPIGPSNVVDADAPLETLFLSPAGLTTGFVVVRDDTVIGIIDGKALASIRE